MASETKEAVKLIHEVLVELLANQTELKTSIARIETAVVESISELRRRDDGLDSSIQRVHARVNRNDERLQRLERITKT